MRLFGSMKIENNVLEIGGVKTTDLVNNYGTPLYVMDEQLIRDKCREFKKYFNEDNQIAYASKAFLTVKLLDIIKDEGLNLDVVSGGEIYLAYRAGFPMSRVIFHGNNKLIDEIELASRLNVEIFAVDNLYELDILNEVSRRNNKVQKIYLRISPGIEAHTHDYIKTGQIDSKFGFALIENIVMEAVKKAIDYSNIEIVGLHCHLGSQILDLKPYIEAIEIMLGLIKQIKEKLGYIIKELDLGGGFGVYYTNKDNPKSINEFCTCIINKVEELTKKMRIVRPKLIIEPGRSIVANAGTTLYKIGSIKHIPGIRKYVAIDGGMNDNIRPSLYCAEYECVLCNKANNNIDQKVSISGKCCESSDILIKDAYLPFCESGDILGIMSTGAYCYSMSSNYNKLPRPAVVMVNNGVVEVVVDRESYLDLIKKERF